MNGTHRVGWCAAALVVMLEARASFAQSAERAPSAVSAAPQTQQRTERYRLRNGLEVVLEPHAEATHVAIHLRYHVGTRDQPQGYTGLAHLCEHLMFEPPYAGARHYIALLEAMGATHVNGETTPDATMYSESVPAQHLQRALWLESERMGYSFRRLNVQALATQKRVVRNEGRERGGAAFLRFLRSIWHELYPEWHPYFERTEFADDLEAITLDNVRWFHERYYTPANATLVVVGPFDTAATRAWIEQYFGAIVGLPAPQRSVSPPPSITSARAVNLDALVYSDRLSVRWITDAYFRGDDAALDLIAFVLGDAAVGRLQRRLVRTLDYAEDVSVSQRSSALSSEFSINVSCTEEHNANQALGIVDEELERLRTTPVSEAELAAAKRAFIDALRRAPSDPAARAEQLALYSEQSQPDPDLSERDIERYRAVTAAQIQSVAQRAIANHRRLVATLHRSSSAEHEIARASTIESATRRAVTSDLGEHVSCGGRR
ncbi:MAG: pitrilysin family protein [Polyangiales bacterium]